MPIRNEDADTIQFSRCAKYIYDDFKAAVDAKRKKLADEHAALPDDPMRALSAAKAALGDENDNVRTGMIEAYHIAELVHASLQGDESGTGASCQSMEYGMRMVTNRMQEEIQNLRHVSAILGRPSPTGNIPRVTPTKASPKITRTK